MSSPNLRIGQQLSIQSFTDGTPGTVTTGVAGPSPSDDQVLAAVTSVLSQGLPSADTGWMQLPLVNATTLSTAFFAGVNFRVLNRQVTITGAVTITTGAIGTPIGVIGSSWTPTVPVYGSGDTTGVVMGTDGVIRTLSAVAGALTFTLLYPV